jgi:hypothetical protein
VLRDAQHVAGEMVELQRTFVVVGVAVAARVPGRGLEVPREELDLAREIAAVAADAVEEEDQRARSRDRDREARRGFDEDCFQGYSAFAPEILTARARFSLSFFM